MLTEVTIIDGTADRADMMLRWKSIFHLRDRSLAIFWGIGDQATGNNPTRRVLADQAPQSGTSSRP